MTPKKLRRRIVKVLTAIVALWGLAQLIAWKMSSGDEGSDQFNRTAIFGGNEFTSVAESLRSGRIAAVLGGIAVDLRGARLAPEGARLTIDCRLAGVAVAVPEDWRVVVNQSQVKMGDVAVDITDPADLAADAPTLTIDAVVTMGGVAIGNR